MSWLAHSLSKSLRLDDDDGDGEDPDSVVVRAHLTNNEAHLPPTPSTKPQHHHQIEAVETRGVKEDLSEFQQSLTRQFWGVASFLAPSPPPPPPPPPPPKLLDRDRSELADHRRGQSPMASYEVEEEEEEDDVVGVTDEVLAFARNIGMHPETWLDFPLDEEEDLGDFEMSDAQREHTMMIEHFAPRLAALRYELCPCHMSESYFWKVYFVLLHSRLNKQDAEILSTPQVMEARAMWMQELQSQTPTSASKIPEHEWFGRSTSHLRNISDSIHEDYEDYSLASSHTPHYEDTLHRTYPFESSMPSTVYETEEHRVESNEMPFIDKSVIEEKSSIRTVDKNVTVGPSSEILGNSHEDDDDDWPEDDDEIYGCTQTAIALINEEDISFSDLEDDDFQAPSELKFVPKE